MSRKRSDTLKGNVDKEYNATSYHVLPIASRIKNVFVMRRPGEGVKTNFRYFEGVPVFGEAFELFVFQQSHREYRQSMGRNFAPCVPSWQVGPKRLLLCTGKGWRCQENNTSSQSGNVFFRYLQDVPMFREALKGEANRIIPRACILKTAYFGESGTKL